MSFPRVLTVAITAAMFAPTLQAITLEDYVDPNSTYEEAHAVGSFVMENQNYSRQIGGETPDDDTVFQTAYDLQMSANYRKVFSSLPLYWTYSADVSGNMKQQGSYRSDIAGSESNSTSEALVGTISGDYDRYLQSNPNVFWFGNGEFIYNTEYDDPRALLNMGVGYGRVINATPLAKALRVIEDFQRFGLLTAYPSDVVMIEIAQIINKEAEFESKYGLSEYRRAWYEAIETVLMGGGLINGDGLGALGVIKLDDVLNIENISPREHGWRAAAGVSYVIKDFDGSEGDPGLSLSFRYAKPYGYKGQLIEDVTFGRTIDGDGDTTLQNELSYTYEVSDVVDWQNSWKLRLVSSDTETDSTSNEFISKFAYEINNVLTFDVTLNIYDSDVDYVSGVRSRVTTGVKYRLR